ncbi:hypothetical protein FZI85_17935 [Mycobacterium sp. CBMA293]|nr:hypothetical protein [Mycolicibacterium sp. CBMA 360]MUL59921.1 hypothetical protein [Mycolicibacterium sp. CBMA 335]MUL68764.1 hypothetical protein [Mycolicibacterium sp. CBMA 311]MUL93845.1 hypothetical protein [Mycolicibacterium sp. CBMA 230]MUM12895.1 hypothetical protein [Mycolicibacterium sp. CBMA 293]MUM34423.1 hypothetical protein [Mycolicibacterium sp. CBMA 361]
MLCIRSDLPGCRCDLCHSQGAM